MFHWFQVLILHFPSTLRLLNGMQEIFLPSLCVLGVFGIANWAQTALLSILRHCKSTIKNIQIEGIFPSQQKFAEQILLSVFAMHRAVVVITLKQVCAVEHCMGGFFIRLLLLFFFFFFFFPLRLNARIPHARCASVKRKLRTSILKENKRTVTCMRISFCC